MHTPYLKSYKQPARYDHETKFSSVLPVLGALLQSGASLFKNDGADMFVTSRSIRHWSTVSVAVVDVYPTLLWAQMFSLNGCLQQTCKSLGRSRISVPTCIIRFRLRGENWKRGSLTECERKSVLHNNRLLSANSGNTW